jgi:hypothetical protein
MPTRALWVALGVVATALGIVGAFLPLLPTTPFLLLAAYAFSRSSPRLHAWLLTHPRLGPPINRWQAHGAISRRAKLLSTAVMLASLAGSALAGVRGAIVMVQAIVLFCAAAFVLTRPDGPADPP